MQRAEADALVARVREQFAAARRSSAGTTALRWLTAPLSLFAGDDASDDAGNANLDDLGERIDRWATVLRKAAETGRGPDGRAYSWERWREYGDELGEAGATHAGARWEASPIGVGAATAAATGRTAAAPFVAVAGALQTIERNTRRAQRVLLAGGAVAALVLAAGAAVAVARRAAG